MFSGKVCKSGTVFAGSSGKGVSGRAIRGCTGPGLGVGRGGFLGGDIRRRKGGVDVGIAIGAGTDVTVESVDIVLVRSGPRDVADVIGLSKKTYVKMFQNLVWATGYNTFAIPLAAGVLISYGILLTPTMGAVLMSASTVIVSVNAKLLTFR